MKVILEIVEIEGLVRKLSSFSNSSIVGLSIGREREHRGLRPWLPFRPPNLPISFRAVSFDKGQSIPVSVKGQIFDMSPHRLLIGSLCFPGVIRPCIEPDEIPIAQGRIAV